MLVQYGRRGDGASGIVTSVETAIREGRLAAPKYTTFPLARAADALKLMAARKVVGKVVLTTH